MIADTSAHAQEPLFGQVLVGMSFPDADELVRAARDAIDVLGAATGPSDATHALLVRRTDRVSLDLG